MNTILKSRQAWPVLGGLLFCWAFFLWAAGRGFDFADDSFFLLMTANPNAFPWVTNFGDILHPLYIALGGSIVGFRIAGAVLLTICVVPFAWGLSRFLGGREVSQTFHITLLAVCACVFWQYDTWYPTPNYNLLDLCGLLLFFAGLLMATPSVDTGVSDAGDYGAAAIAAALAGIGLTVMVLVKATTAASAGALGLVWLLFLRPRHSLFSVAIAAAISASLVGAAILTIDGSVAVFLAGKSVALAEMKALDANGDLHGIASSITRPFSSELWKLMQSLPFLATMLALGFGWCWVTVTASRPTPRRQVASYAIAALFAVMVGWWRSIALEGGPVKGYHAWYVAMLVLFLILAGFVAWTLRSRIGRQQHRLLIGVIILAAAPISYAFGTDGVLILHAGSACVFWVAAMLATAFLLPDAWRPHLLMGTAFLVTVVTVGMLAGTMITPGHVGAPLWKQTEEIEIGALPARIRVEPAMAEYVQALQQGAKAHGFEPGMPIVDLSGAGPGMMFALGGRPVGAPWLHIQFSRGADLPTMYLNRAPKSQSHSAWLITGDDVDLARSVLKSQGINWPADYEEAGRAERPDKEWKQILWKPRG